MADANETACRAVNGLFHPVFQKEGKNWQTNNGIGLAALGAAASGRVETDLAQRRQIRKIANSEPPLLRKAKPIRPARLALRGRFVSRGTAEVEVRGAKERISAPRPSIRILVSGHF